MPNTIIWYLYRDADNFKYHKVVILKGALTLAERKLIEDSLEEEQYFIPLQVGLPDLLVESGWTLADKDHPWHELEDIVTTESKKPTLDMTASEFAHKFKDIVWAPDDQNPENLPIYMGMNPALDKQLGQRLKSL